MTKSAGLLERSGPKARRTNRSAESVASYIADISAGLALMAREANLEVLGHLLDMTRLEAIQHFSEDAPSLVPEEPTTD